MTTRFDALANDLESGQGQYNTIINVYVPPFPRKQPTAHPKQKLAKRTKRSRSTSHLVSPGDLEWKPFLSQRQEEVRGLEAQ